MATMHINGEPWRLQRDINTSQSGNIASWNYTSFAIPIATAYAGAVVTKDRAYLIGGRQGTYAVTTIYSCSVASDGALGTWSSYGNLPVATEYACIFVTKNRLHVIGGSPVENVRLYQTAPINSDGTLGTWTSTTNALPSPGVSQGAVFVNRGNVYILGGFIGSTVYSSIFRASINTDGTLGTWTLETATLPIPLYGFGLAVTTGKVYLISGYTSGGLQAKTYSATMNTDGTLGAFSDASRDIPVAISGAGVFVSHDNIYVLGGWGQTGVKSTAYRITINTDGSLGASWTTGTTNIYTGMGAGALIVTDSRVHMLAHTLTGGAKTQNIYTGTITGGKHDYLSDSWVDEIPPNYGFVAPPIEAVSGSMVSYPTPGVGDITPALEAVSSNAGSVFPPRLADGAISQVIARVSAKAYSSFAFGKITPRFEAIAAYSIGTSIAFGKIGRKRDSVSGFGVVHNCYGNGEIIPNIDHPSGYATTTQTAFCAINPPVSIVTGTATTYKISYGIGRIHDSLPLIYGETLSPVTGRIWKIKDRVNGFAGSTIFATGIIRPQLETIHAKSKATLSTSLQPMMFQRDNAIAGTAQALPVNNILSFTRT